MIQKLCVINKQHSVASSSHVWDAATPSSSPSPLPLSISLSLSSCALQTARYQRPVALSTLPIPNPQSRNPQATNHNVAECPKQRHRAFARRVVLVTPPPPPPAWCML